VLFFVAKFIFARQKNNFEFPMISFQKFPDLLEFILIGLVGFFYFMYIVRISYVAIVLKTNFRMVFVKLIVRSIYFLLIITALMAPSFGDVKKEIQSIGKDIYILIDLSQSMNVRDVEPSRLEKLKFELKHIADAFNSDRIGLIIFSSDAYVQCPLTFDQSALHLFIETLSTSLVPAGGTDFGSAIALALKRFKNSEIKAGSEKSKIMLLISDGEDFGDETENYATELGNQNIKLFTLGIGTEQGGKIPTENGVKFDENGEVIVSKLNAGDLKKLAAITDGKYYEVSNNRNDIKRLINDINKIEGELREIKTVDASANKYFYFLVIALAFIVLDVLITVKTIKI
jgi:Ca-activated chloride channel homolog